MNDNRFFNLLRSALNGEAMECELGDRDWQSVFLLSMRQSVTGVLWPVAFYKRIKLKASEYGIKPF
jgi:hypothetical protein